MSKSWRNQNVGTSRTVSPAYADALLRMQEQCARLGLNFRDEMQMLVSRWHFGQSASSGLVPLEQYVARKVGQLDRLRRKQSTDKAQTNPNYAMALSYLRRRTLEQLTDLLIIYVTQAPQDNEETGNEETTGGLLRVIRSAIYLLLNSKGDV